MGKIYIDEVNTIDRLIDRSKDTNIIYLTEDTILNTKAVQKIANRLEQLEKENKELEEANKELAEENERLAEALDKLMETTGCYTECKPFQCLQYGIKAYDKRLKDSIPKSVIREKIEALNDSNSKFYKRVANHTEYTLSELVRNILKEVLGE